MTESDPVPNELTHEAVMTFGPVTRLTVLVVVLVVFALLMLQVVSAGIVEPPLSSNWTFVLEAVVLSAAPAGAVMFTAGVLPKLTSTVAGAELPNAF